jgi:hypothetical protein
MRVSVVGEKSNFSKDAEAFDGAAYDSGRLEQVVSRLSVQAHHSLK